MDSEGRGFALKRSACPRTALSLADCRGGFPKRTTDCTSEKRIAPNRFPENTPSPIARPRAQLGKTAPFPSASRLTRSVHNEVLSYTVVYNMHARTHIPSGRASWHRAWCTHSKESSISHAIKARSYSTTPSCTDAFLNANTNPVALPCVKTQAMSHRSLARSCHLVRLLVIFLRGIRAIGHLVAVLDLLQHVGEVRGHEFRQVLLVQGG